VNPLTDQQIRSSFVNASRREVNQAILPELASLPWGRLDDLGWRDRKRPLVAYVVLELAGTPTGVVLRGTGPSEGPRRKAVCAWCEDVVVSDDVSLYVARRAGARGRQGDTVGTLICTEFTCSGNVRRPPTRSEVGSDDPADREALTQRRIAGLQERSARFVSRLLQ
jgi:hypothetical protein